MTLLYPWPARDGPVFYGLQLLFGLAMLRSILLGIAAIRRRDCAQHGDWMLRGCAIGMGAGTHARILLIGELLAGPASELSRALLMDAAWVINLTIAEWRIRNRCDSAPQSYQRFALRRSPRKVDRPVSVSSTPPLAHINLM
jgi:Predicted membrane protein (DUF2306)